MTTETNPARNAKLLAIASGKGGVGKTWCAVNLCQALAQQGKRVLLFDGDLGLANVDIQLGLTPAKDLGHVLSGAVPFADAISRYEKGGFDILAGRSGSGSLSDLAPAQFALVRGGLLEQTKRYDRVILDLGAGIDRTVRALSSDVSRAVVIITPEPTALTDAYAFIKVLAAKPPAPEFQILVNMADNAADGERAYKTLLKACQSFLNLSPQLVGIIRRDKAAAQSIRSQTSLLSLNPKSPAAVDILAAAGRL
jgi:flagellar biosynthesis protein FlhG